MVYTYAIVEGNFMSKGNKKILKNSVLISANNLESAMTKAVNKISGWYTNSLVYTVYIKGWENADEWHPTFIVSRDHSTTMNKKYLHAIGWSEYEAIVGKRK